MWSRFRPYFRNVSVGLCALFLLPMAASAQITESANAGPFQNLLGNILELINSVLIPFIIGIGFLTFVWGMFLYFIAGGGNDDAKEKGKQLVINATFGFVVIIIFFGMVNFIVDSIGLEGEFIRNVPRVPTIEP